MLIEKWYVQRFPPLTQLNPLIAFEHVSLYIQKQFAGRWETVCMENTNLTTRHLPKYPQLRLRYSKGATDSRTLSTASLHSFLKGFPLKYPYDSAPCSLVCHTVHTQRDKYRQLNQTSIVKINQKIIVKINQTNIGK